MASPLLLFENMYDTATISSSSEASGYIDDNVKDWRPGSPYRWKAGSLTPPAFVKADQGVGGTLQPDTVAIGGHNLASAGARYKVQWSTDNSSYTNAFSETVAADDKPVLVKFTVSGVKRYWRVLLDKVSGNFLEAPQIGIITLGRRLEMPSGGVPDGYDPYGEEALTDWNHADNGAPLGANLRSVAREFTLNVGPPGFLVSEFFRPASGLGFDLDFKPHARSKWWWYAWNTAIEPAPALCRVNGRIATPLIGSVLRRGLTLPMMCFEDA